jgi:hypothetical protein
MQECLYNQPLNNGETMSKMSEIHIAISNMIDFNYSIESIATILDVPFEWVEAVCEQKGIKIENAYDSYDGQPDEAQEWESFDPDC